jgi:hypothetical protein
MAIARLQSIANVDLGDAEKTILALANLRNNIEHFAVDLPKQQADSIIGRTVPFLASFVSNELGRRFQLEIGDKVWQNLIRIQEYRDNAINTAKKMIASRDEQPYYCEACQEDTAIKVYYREDEWSLHSYNVSCLACLDLVSVGMVCLGCQKENSISQGNVGNYDSYCSDCKRKAANEFKGMEFPTYGYEIRRWFRKHDSITYDRLLSFVKNVSTLGSGAVRLPDQLFRIGAIDFADEFYKKRHKKLKGMSYAGLYPFG